MENIQDSDPSLKNIHDSDPSLEKYSGFGSIIGKYTGTTDRPVNVRVNFNDGGNYEYELSTTYPELKM